MGFFRRLLKQSAGKTSRSTRLRFFYDQYGARQNWNKIRPPAKPSNEELEIYKDYFSSISPKNKILILGSTPALRQLVSGSGAKNYIIADFSFLMIGVNSRFCEGVNFEDEIWIKADWLDLPLPLNYFDVILGDSVLWQFVPEKQKNFLEKIASLLRDNGSFITRTHVVNQQIFQYSPEIVIQEVLAKLPEGDEEALINTLILSRLRDRLGNPKTQTTDPRRMLKTLRAYQPKNPLEEKFLKKVEVILAKRQELALEYITQSDQIIEVLFEKLFKIIKKESAKDYEDANFFPIYHLVKSS